MQTRQLNSSPRILPMYARAALPMIPGASLLPFVGGGGGDVPDIELVLSGVAVDPAQLAAYLKVCGFAPGGALPATYPHMLVFPLHLALMTDARFPFAPIGLVHIANRIVQHRPLRAHEQLDLRVHATPLEEHPRGRSFSLLSQAHVAGELVWEETSTMLRRGRTSSPGTKSGKPRSDADAGAPPTATEEWSIPEDLGRRYAAVSGDRNPIHMHQLTAKPLGFPSAIAHGMWTKARCLAALQQRLPDGFAVDVSFRAPIALPSTVAFASTEEGERIGFTVRDAARGTTHLEGQLAPIHGESTDDASHPNERSEAR